MYYNPYIHVHTLEVEEDNRLRKLSAVFLPCIPPQLSKQSASLMVEVPSSTSDGCLYVQVSN